MSSISSEPENQYSRFAKLGLKGLLSSETQRKGLSQLYGSSNTVPTAQAIHSSLSQQGYGLGAGPSSSFQHKSISDIQGEHLPQIKSNMILSNNFRNQVVNNLGEQAQTSSTASMLDRSLRHKRSAINQIEEPSEQLIPLGTSNQFSTPTRPSKSMKDELKDWLIGKGQISPDSLMKPTSTFMNGSQSNIDLSEATNYKNRASQQQLYVSPSSQQSAVLMKRRLIRPLRTTQISEPGDTSILDSDDNQATNNISGQINCGSHQLISLSRIEDDSPRHQYSSSTILPPINSSISVMSSSKSIGFFDFPTSQMRRGQGRKSIRNFSEILKIDRQEQQQPPLSQNLSTVLTTHKKAHSSGLITISGEQKKAEQIEGDGYSSAIDQFDTSVKKLHGMKKSGEFFCTSFSEKNIGSYTLTQSQSATSIRLPTHLSSAQNTLIKTDQNRRSSRRHLTSLDFSAPKSILKIRNIEEDHNSRTNNIIFRKASGLAAVSAQRKKNVIFNDRVEKYVI